MTQNKNSKIGLEDDTINEGISKIANGNHLYKSENGKHIDISVHGITKITYTNWKKGNVNGRDYWHREMNITGRDGINTLINLFSEINPKNHVKENK